MEAQRISAQLEGSRSCRGLLEMVDLKENLEGEGEVEERERWEPKDA